MNTSWQDSTSGPGLRTSHRLVTEPRVLIPVLFAYAAGITGIVGNLYLIGFYLGEFGPRVPGVPRSTLLLMGATSDLVGALSAALMIPVVLGLSRSLRPGRATRATQAGGIVVMAWLAIAGPLVARGDVDFVVQVPTAQLLFLWVFLTSRLLVRSPSWSRPARLGRAIGRLWMTALLIIVVSLPLPWMSLPQQIILVPGLLVGVVAWLAVPVWLLTVGRALTSARLVAGCQHPEAMACGHPGPVAAPPIASSTGSSGVTDSGRKL